jgi:hypothetical protein
MPSPRKTLFGSTIFLSSFLLFLIQPMIAKRILPWFGGSTAVWTTCLLFFQVLLLAGYFYAHLLVRYLSLRAQVITHSVLLTGSLLLLPVTPSAVWKPTGGEDPAVRILLLLSATIGLPYLLLSTTSPLIQSWYAQAAAAAGAVRTIPYRLFALSNLASMLSLLAYPVLIEPRVGTERQLLTWSICYAGFAALCCAAAWQSPRTNDVLASPDASPPVSLLDRLTWLSLSACGSAMLLAVTNHLTQNVAAIPFLWVLPLSLYLLTFIVAFDHERWYIPLAGLLSLGIALVGMSYALDAIPNGKAVRVGIPVYSAGLFLTCLFCHGELARRKPAAHSLTTFYLMLSVGGAMGALFVSIFAPRVFSGFYEFPVAMVACAIMALWLSLQRPAWPRALFAAVVLIVVMSFALRHFQFLRIDSRVSVRNFYGGLRVRETGKGANVMRELIHGTINHGEQYLDPKRRDQPTSYYGPETGAGLAIARKHQERPSGIRVGIVGLGTGTLAAYGRPGDEFHFYELNPLVLGVARTWFSFLNDSKARIEVSIGDGRLSLEREPPHNFDVIAVDAFSSDSIPVHLLTREALQSYFRQLAPDGIVALHISNRNVDLEPVAAGLAASVHCEAFEVDTDSDEDLALAATDWVLIPRRPLPPGDPWRTDADLIKETPGFRGWTDDFSNLFQVWK